MFDEEKYAKMFENMSKISEQLNKLYPLSRTF